LSEKEERRMKKYGIFWSDIKGEIRGRKRRERRWGDGLEGKLLREF